MWRMGGSKAATTGGRRKVCACSCPQPDLPRPLLPPVITTRLAPVPLLAITLAVCCSTVLPPLWAAHRHHRAGAVAHCCWLLLPLWRLPALLSETAAGWTTAQDWRLALQALAAKPGAAIVACIAIYLQIGGEGAQRRTTETNGKDLDGNRAAGGWVSSGWASGRSAPSRTAAPDPPCGIRS